MKMNIHYMDCISLVGARPLVGLLDLLAGIVMLGSGGFTGDVIDESIFEGPKGGKSVSGVNSSVGTTKSMSSFVLNRCRRLRINCFPSSVRIA